MCFGRLWSIGASNPCLVTSCFHIPSIQDIIVQVQLFALTVDKNPISGTVITFYFQKEVFG